MRHYATGRNNIQSPSGLVMQGGEGGIDIRAFVAVKELQRVVANFEDMRVRREVHASWKRCEEHDTDFTLRCPVCGSEG